MNPGRNYSFIIPIETHYYSSHYPCLCLQNVLWLALDGKAGWAVPSWMISSNLKDNCILTNIFLCNWLDKASICKSVIHLDFGFQKGNIAVLQMLSLNQSFNNTWKKKLHLNGFFSPISFSPNNTSLWLSITEVLWHFLKNMFALLLQQIFFL